MIDPKPEQEARKLIDAMLVAAGWVVADRKDAGKGRGYGCAAATTAKAPR